MTTLSSEKTLIIRTERGLTIAGTRITLYDVIDFLKAQYPPKLIRDKFNLTDEQISAVLSYIETNNAAVETEYQEVLQTREEIFQYWEERNREHFAKIGDKPRKPEKQTLLAKLEQQKAQRASVNS